MRTEGLNVAIVCDLGGQLPIASRRFLELDRDRFDDVIRTLRVTAPVPTPSGRSGEAPPISLEIRSLEDFHPDRLIRLVPDLAQLYEARIHGPSADAALRLREFAGPPRSDRDGRPAPHATSIGDLGQRQLLDAVLSASTEESGGPLAGKGGAGALEPLAPLIRKLVASVTEGSIVPADDPVAGLWRESVEAELAARLRSILHDQEFAELEARWRGLAAIAFDEGFGADCSVRVLDLPEGALDAVLVAESGQGAGWLERRIEEDVPDVCAVIVARRFGEEQGDFVRLHRIGGLADRLGVPAIASASPRLLGIADAGQLAIDGRAAIARDAGGRAWAQLRASAEGRRLALCMPRIVQREPYGMNREPIDSFGFEENERGAGPAFHLWGDPALAFARVILGAFAVRGEGDLDLGAAATIENLPLRYEEESDPSSGEVVLADSAIEALIEQGLVVPSGSKGLDSVRFRGLRTIDGTRLAVRTSRGR